MASISFRVAALLATFLLFFMTTSLAVPLPGPQAIEACKNIGQRSGCSGCNAIGSCEWCVTKDDEAQSNSLTPQNLCLPKGSCGRVEGASRVSAHPQLCPVNVREEKPYQGLLITSAASTIFSVSHYPKYCAFGADITTGVNIARGNASFAYPIDRSVSRGSNACGSVNSKLNEGLGGYPLALIARTCFNSHQPPLTPQMMACLEAYQAFRTSCTKACPKYGLAVYGFCKSSCDAVQRICKPFIDVNKKDCILSELPEVFARECIPDSPTCEHVNRVPASYQWAFEYGLNATYDLKLDCSWTSWSPTCVNVDGSCTGWRTRSRRAECGGATVDYLKCQRPGCVDCAFSWTQWTACTPGSTFGTSTRSATITAQPDGPTAKPCPAPQSRPCNGITQRVRWIIPQSGSTGFDPSFFPQTDYTSNLFFNQDFASSYAQRIDGANWGSSGSGIAGPRTRPRLVDGYQGSIQTSKTLTNLDIYGIEGWSSIYVDAAGEYTFFIELDDAVTITITGPNSFSQTINHGCCLTKYSVVDFPEVGTYTFSFRYFDAGGPDYFTIMVAQGNFNSVPESAKLLGSTDAAIKSFLTAPPTFTLKPGFVTANARTLGYSWRYAVPVSGFVYRNMEQAMAIFDGVQRATGGEFVLNYELRYNWGIVNGVGTPIYLRRVNEYTMSLDFPVSGKWTICSSFNGLAFFTELDYDRRAQGENRILYSDNSLVNGVRCAVIEDLIRGEHTLRHVTYQENLGYSSVVVTVKYADKTENYVGTTGVPDPVLHYYKRS